MKTRNKARQAGIIAVIISLSFMAAFIVPMSGQQAKAASAAINLALSSSEIMIGDTFSVVLTVESSEDIGELEVYLSFDKKALKFVSGGKYVTGGKGLVFIMDHSDQTGTSKKYSMKFKARKAGETTLKISDSKVLCALDNLDMSISRNQLLFTVKDPERISDNTELKALSVTPGDLVPEFSPDTSVYRVEVDAATEALTLSAHPADSKASVSVRGNEGFVTGKNEVNIKVTAPSGDSAVTTITVIKRPEGAGANMQSGENISSRQSEEEGTENTNPASNSQKDSQGTGQELPETGITAVEEEGGSIYVTDFQQIRVLPLDDTSSLPEDFIATAVVISGVPVTVYSPQYDLDSDLLLLYGENREGKAGFYLFNRKTEKLREYDGEFSDWEAQQQTSKTKEEEETEQYRHSMWKMILLSAILGLFCAGLIAALLIQSIRHKKGKREKIQEEDIFSDHFDL